MDNKSKLELIEMVTAFLGFLGVVGLVTMDIPQIDEFAENVATVVFGAVAIVDTARHYFFPSRGA